MQSAEGKSTSSVKVSLFTPVPRVPRTILPAGPTQAEPECFSAFPVKQRKLPPGIAPPEKKQPSKSVEIISNSGLRNPALVNFKRH